MNGRPDLQAPTSGTRAVIPRVAVCGHDGDCPYNAIGTGRHLLDIVDLLPGRRGRLSGQPPWRPGPPGLPFVAVVVTASVRR
jgi:hypothetical protein